MAESDVDSWYDWKREDNFTEPSRKTHLEASKTVESFNPNYFDKSSSNATQKGSSQINGFVRYHADLRSSRSSSEVRFINPAIYAESLDKEDEDHKVQFRVKLNSKDGEEDRNRNGDIIRTSCGDSTEVRDLISTLSIKNDLTTSPVGYAGDHNKLPQETYRCYSSTSAITNSSLEPSTVRSKSIISSGPTVRMERRCKIEKESNKDDLYSARKTEPEVQRYILNGHRVVHVSTTSYSNTSISEHRLGGSDFARKIVHDEWLRKKQQAAQRKREAEELAEKKKQAELEKLAREKEEKARRERESFFKWQERKKKEEEQKRTIIIKQLELQKRLKEIEDEAAVAKALCLRQWARKKKEEQKACQKRQELKQRQIEEERKKRLEESTKAYEKWREMSKNKPKPATQGLLPHQKAQPAYVNPTPWQRILDESSDEAQEDTSVCRKPGMSQSKINSRKSIARSYH